jgi:hypothetical protein
MPTRVLPGEPLPWGPPRCSPAVDAGEICGYSNIGGWYVPCSGDNVCGTEFETGIRRRAALREIAGIVGNSDNVVVVNVQPWTLTRRSGGRRRRPDLLRRRGRSRLAEHGQVQGARVRRLAASTQGGYDRPARFCLGFAWRGPKLTKSGSSRKNSTPARTPEFVGLQPICGLGGVRVGGGRTVGLGVAVEEAGLAWAAASPRPRLFARDRRIFRTERR